MFTEVLLVLLTLNVVESKFEPKVVKGSRVDIGYFAHSAFIQINFDGQSFVCGSSIINQMVLLTAAHCVDNCVKAECYDNAAYTGHMRKRAGIRTRLAGFFLHESYKKRKVNDDIGLVLLRDPLKLGRSVKRIALMRRPPFKKYAEIAGWGLINEENIEETDYLHFAESKVWTYEECRTHIKSLPRGVLCGGQLRGNSFASEGDSGSALVIDKYVQIGLVSFKRPDISRSLVAFTNVSYYYDWITKHAKRLYCLKTN